MWYSFPFSSLILLIAFSVKSTHLDIREGTMRWSLVGCSLQGCKELNITEHEHMHAYNEVEHESHCHIVIVKDCKDWQFICSCLSHQHLQATISSEVQGHLATQRHLDSDVPFTPFHYVADTTLRFSPCLALFLLLLPWWIQSPFIIGQKA